MANNKTMRLIISATSSCRAGLVGPAVPAEVSTLARPWYWAHHPNGLSLVDCPCEFPRAPSRRSSPRPQSRHAGLVAAYVGRPHSSYVKIYRASVSLVHKKHRCTLEGQG